MPHRTVKALDHKFGAYLICAFCDLSWSEHQESQRPCTHDKLDAEAVPLTPPEPDSSNYCKRGHPHTKENGKYRLRTSGNWLWECLKCRRIKSRRGPLTEEEIGGRETA